MEQPLNLSGRLPSPEKQAEKPAGFFPDSTPPPEGVESGKPRSGESGRLVIPEEVRNPETVYAIKGRVWVQVRREPYTRKDGIETELMVWHTKCARCSETVEIKTPVVGFEKSNSFGIKHCPAHKLWRKGQPVSIHGRACTLISSAAGGTS